MSLIAHHTTASVDAAESHTAEAPANCSHQQQTVTSHKDNGQASDQLRIWGLTIQQLHDAYWLSRGVQCVRLGQSARLEIADLYMLLRRHQLVLFDFDAVLGPLIWQGASITSIRVIEEMGGYHEAAVIDEAGYVQRIERRYNVPPKSTGMYLTQRLAHAAMWSSSTSRRSWRDAMRRAFPSPLVARQRCRGRNYDAQDAHQCTQFLTELIERWPDPERVIEGLEVLPNGVLIQQGDPPPAATVIGPAWIGTRCDPVDTNDTACIIGPAYLPDQNVDRPSKAPVHIRSLSDVVAPRRSGELPQCWQRGARVSLYPITKRAIDVAVSAAVLICLMPVMAAIAAAIVIDDGFPVLFRHRRQSRHGRPFHCLKFRTMHKNAEQMVPQLKARNICDGPQVHIENDPRATRIGQLLRKLHLDELPQFWNVLVGDMSLVGPRPSPDAENRICPAWRELRLSVRPGITGLWQISRTRQPGRDFQEWIRFDVQYVRTANLWLDLRICVRTAKIMLLGRKTR